MQGGVAQKQALLREKVGTPVEISFTFPLAKDKQLPKPSPKSHVAVKGALNDWAEEDALHIKHAYLPGLPDLHRGASGRQSSGHMDMGGVAVRGSSCSPPGRPLRPWHAWHLCIKQHSPT